MDNRKVIFNAGYVILLVYVLYGIFFWFIPEFTPDEFWTSSRAVFFSKHGHIGEPMLPTVLSPYFGSLFVIAKGSQLLGILKTGLVAIIYKISGAEIHHCQRIVSFLFSVLLCLATFRLAIIAGLNRFVAKMSVILLIITPEFFSQIHTERPEILVAFFFLTGIILFVKILGEENKSKKTLFIIVAAILTTLPCILVHASAIAIAGTFGLLYLIYEKKNLFSLNTILYGGISLLIVYWFYDVITAPALYAESVGGGNFLKFQSPPITRGIKQIIMLPWIFYNKLCDDTIFSRPVSMLFLLLAFSSFLFLRKKEKDSKDRTIFNILIIAIITSTFILTLLSGSYGNYLIVIYPLVAILLAYAIDVYLNVNSNRRKPVIIATLTLLFLLFNFSGIKERFNSKAEFDSINNQIASAIPEEDATVVGMPFYYLPFTERNYYSYGWLNPFVGYKDESFEESIQKSKTTSIIIDDVFVSKAFVDRGEAWTDSMFSFLKDHCSVTKTISTNYFMNKLVREPKYYPVSWHHADFKKSYLRKIVVYRVNG